MLLALAVGMFAYAFALVPLYNVICEITGINGKTSSQAALVDEIRSAGTADSRSLKVEFLADAARGMPWEFRPSEAAVVVRPGEMNSTTFYVRNRAKHSVTGQAVPSVSPGQAAKYLRKVECFCFEQQELPAGGEMEMGVSFYIDADIPMHINELTLSYTMFLVGDLENEPMASHHE